MNKKLLVALADAIREHNRIASGNALSFVAFDSGQIETLADFCYAQNPNFNRDRWMSYIAGECGPSGGAVKGAN